MAFPLRLRKERKIRTVYSNKYHVLEYFDVSPLKVHPSLKGAPWLYDLCKKNEGNF